MNSIMGGQSIAPTKAVNDEQRVVLIRWFKKIEAYYVIGPIAFIVAWVGVTTVSLQNGSFSIFNSYAPILIFIFLLVGWLIAVYFYEHRNAPQCPQCKKQIFIRLSSFSRYDSFLYLPERCLSCGLVFIEQKNVVNIAAQHKTNARAIFLAMAVLLPSSFIVVYLTKQSQFFKDNPILTVLPVAIVWLGIIVAFALITKKRKNKS